MKTIRCHFGALEAGDTFIFNGTIYKKERAGAALNCHTLRTSRFKPEQLVEVLPTI